MTSEWMGDKQNGVEVRYQGDEVDEFCVYVNGECIVHSERMDDGLFAVGVLIDNRMAAIQFHSRTGRAAIDCSAELDA